MATKDVATELAILADCLMRLSIARVDQQFTNEGSAIWDDAARLAVYREEYQRRGVSMPQ